MTTPIAYGVDFGTTNSAIAIAYQDNVDVLALESQSPETQLPSIVYLHREGVEAAGSEAVRAYLANGSRKTRCSNCALVDHELRLSDCYQYRPGGGCNDARLMSGLKEHLSNSGLGTHSWAQDFDLTDLVAVILRRLKREADRHVGAAVNRVVLGHPVNFPGTEGANYRASQQAALSQLEAAAISAGFEEFALFPEPAAALVDEQLDEGTVLALDFGGGTFDAALVRFGAEGGTVIALQGADVGGELFNAALFEGKVAPVFGLDGGARVPAYIRRHLRTMSGARFLMSDPNFWSSIRGAGTLEEVFAGGHVFNFYRAIEDAKIRLSTQAETRIELHRPGVDMDIGVTRRELEGWIQPHIGVVSAVVDETLRQAGESAESVDLVIRTGGTSSVPLFVDAIMDKFGQDKVQERHLFDSVAHGLGSQAQLIWGSR